MPLGVHSLFKHQLQMDLMNLKTLFCYDELIAFTNSLYIPLSSSLVVRLLLLSSVL